MDKREFVRRRRRVMAEMDELSIAIVPTAPTRQRNRDIEYIYRPDSDFYYLTGFPEPEAVAVFIPGRSQGEYILFCRERDAEMEQWHGARAGLEGACADYGADDAFPIGDMDDILPGLIENRSSVYYAMGYEPDFDKRVIGWVNQVKARSARSGANSPAEFVALDHQLHEMRLYKSAAEVRTMRRAGEISAAAHVRAMQVCRPGMREFQLAAALSYEFTNAGCIAPAYPSIVASGANACVLHYITNRDAMRDGDLVLIDAGAEFEGYAGDITRTFPVNGKFSPEQRTVYTTVLAAQYAAIDAVRPGNDWNAPHEAALAVLVEGLLEMGLLQGSVEENIEKDTYREFYMHRTGHWLGMDVHDVGDYKIEGTWRALDPGMVTTVEPGLYIPSHDGIPPQWRGIGVRIEDDVLVGKEGPDVLTQGVPKDVADVEALVGTGGDRA